MPGRREVLQGIAGATLAAVNGSLIPHLAWGGSAPAGPEGLPAGAIESTVLEALSGKKPLIKRTFRPPNFETPVNWFNDLLTPNDAFFVRYHLAGIRQVNGRDWRLRIGGESVEKSVEFTLEDLRKKFKAVEIVAVNQCSGNRRGLYQPHVPGIQWGYGAMGNARWRGVRLKDVLNKAGVKKDALEVTFDGADGPVFPATPDFVKSLPVWKALEENALIAFEMNGAPLPHWHGYPARLVVPGWTATYWVKHLTTINVVAKPFDGFWMKTAYRVPKGAFPTANPFTSQDTEANTPITEIMVNSLVTNMESGQRFSPGQAINAKGIAWDRGTGIAKVEVSADGGQQWLPAELGKDAGNFSWRQWQYRYKPAQKGTHSLMFRATNRAGATQTSQLVPNPSGYHHNLVQVLDIVVA